MSNLETHEQEQAEITADCEAGTCDHPECKAAGLVETILERVTEALETYADATGADTPGGMLRDMLGDLRHFADANGLDFAQEDESAYQVYLEEREG